LHDALPILLFRVLWPTRSKRMRRFLASAPRCDFLRLICPAEQTRARLPLERRRDPELRAWPSLAPPKGSRDHLAKTGNFAGDAPARDQAVAIVVQAETLREAEAPTRTETPRQRWRQIVRCLLQAEMMAVAEATIHFHTDEEIFATEIAAVSRCF